MLKKYRKKGLTTVNGQSNPPAFSHISILEPAIIRESIRLCAPIPPQSTGAESTVIDRLKEWECDLRRAMTPIDSIESLIAILPLLPVNYENFRYLSEALAEQHSNIELYKTELAKLENSCKLTKAESSLYKRVERAVRDIEGLLFAIGEKFEDCLSRSGFATRVLGENAKVHMAKPKGASGATAKSYQLKITLRHSKPPIWRRVVVPADYDLGSLHYLIQKAMGWHNEHCHQFEIRGRNYADERADCDGYSILDEDDVELNELNLLEGDRFIYWYDFGDDWYHVIEVEKASMDECDGARCIGGKRACPPEDSGGIYGYYNLLYALKHANHPRHEEAIDWLGDDFDPEYFSL